jgi:protein-tyrosine kinase
VSRIEEALRRRQGRLADESSPIEPPPQRLFAPAWQVGGVPTERQATQPGSHAGVPAGNIPTPGMLSFASTWKERLATGANADAGLVEQFRRLAANLHQAHHVHGLKSVMITSASPGDGKTLTAVNLALVLAESYRYKVLLVDADLRRPSIPNTADVSEGSGLSDVLRSPTEQKLALVPITPGVTLLPAGRPVANSLDALTSPRMRQILDEATARFDWVVLDAPPVGATADARLLTQLVGGTLFVVHAGRTQYAHVQKAVDTIGREHIMGIVLNGVDELPSEGAYYYGAARQASPG